MRRIFFECIEIKLIELNRFGADEIREKREHSVMIYMKFYLHNRNSGKSFNEYLRETDEVDTTAKRFYQLFYKFKQTLSSITFIYICNNFFSFVLFYFVLFCRFLYFFTATNLYMCICINKYVYLETFGIVTKDFLPSFRCSFEFLPNTNRISIYMYEKMRMKHHRLRVCCKVN